MGDYLKAFFARPFKGAQEMGVMDWFLFLGLIIILLVGWRIIFRHIMDATD